MSHGHGHAPADGENKYIAIFISVLALFLAIAETFAKGAQTNVGLLSGQDDPPDHAAHHRRTGRS